MQIEPEKMAAICISGKTIEEIENELEHLSFEQLQKLMVMLNCDIGEITEKICRAKGIKCSTKPNSTTKLKNTNDSNQAGLIS